MGDYDPHPRFEHRLYQCASRNAYLAIGLYLFIAFSLPALYGARFLSVLYVSYRVEAQSFRTWDSRVQSINLVYISECVRIYRSYISLAADILRGVGG